MDNHKILFLFNLHRVSMEYNRDYLQKSVNPKWSKKMELTLDDYWSNLTFFITITIFKPIGTEHSPSRRILSYFSLNKAYCWIFFCNIKSVYFLHCFFFYYIFPAFEMISKRFFHAVGAWPDVFDYENKIPHTYTQTHFTLSNVLLFLLEKRIEKETNEPKKCPIGQ